MFCNFISLEHSENTSKERCWIQQMYVRF